MTKTELKMILKLIDLHTIEVEHSYQSYDTRISNISGLKRDIEELFGKGEKK